MSNLLRWSASDIADPVRRFLEVRIPISRGGTSWTGTDTSTGPTETR